MKRKKVNAKAWACVTKRGRVRYVSIHHSDTEFSAVPQMGDRIAKCRLVEITKKRKVRRGS